MFDPRQLIPFLTPVLAGLAAGAFLWLGYAGVRPSPDPEQLIRPLAALEAPDASSIDRPSTADLVSMALFPEMPAAAPATDPDLGAATLLRLHGVSILPRRRAALISAGGGAPAWVAEGATHAGVTVDQVGLRSIQVSAGGTSREVRLFGGGDRLGGDGAASLGLDAGVSDADGGQ